jgi:transmembrane sensor
MKEPEGDILKQFGFGDDQLLREVLSGMDQLRVEPIISKEEAWARFGQSVTMRQGMKPESRVWTWGLAWKIAASVVVLLSAWLGFRAWNKTSYVTANSQVKEFKLPDNSTVMLNASSKLTFEKFKWETSRRVELSGEALFMVKKGTHFEITTRGKIIRVLGTVFNVFSRENYFEVRCISGKVEVQIPGSTKVLLTKGNAVKQEARGKGPVTFDVTTSTGAWINGDFYYTDAELRLVFDEIARQFNVHISGEMIDRRYSGYFNKSTLTEALNNVCLPMGLTYRISKDTVIIRKGF